MSFTNFRFEIDADGIAARDLGHARPVDERHHPRGDGRACRASSTRSPGDDAIKGCVITSGKEAFSGGADLTMLQGLRAAYERLAPRRAQEEAMRFFFEESRKLSLLYRRLETCGKPFAAAMHGVCLGGAFELALACHLRVLSDADSTRVGLPEIKVGLFPGRRRHAARRAPDADRRCAADAVQGRADPPAHGPQHGPRARGRAARRDRAGGQGLDQGRRLGGRALGREGLQAALEQGLLGRRHADLARRERDLPPRDAGQLPGRLRHPGGGLPGPAAPDGSGPEGRVALVRQDPALEGGGGDDPHALRVDAGTQQGRAPAEGRAADETRGRSAWSARASWARASPT